VQRAGGCKVPTTMVGGEECRAMARAERSTRSRFFRAIQQASGTALGSSDHTQTSRPARTTAADQGGSVMARVWKKCDFGLGRACAFRLVTRQFVNRTETGLFIVARGCVECPVPGLILRAGTFARFRA
jgi:hypothetical protein